MKICTFTFYLVAYLCTLINADVGNPTGRIFHGTEVTDCASYPWHAQIVYGDNIDCGGTLVSDRFVVTSAHCSNNCKAGSDYTIYLGSTKQLEGTKYEGHLLACFGDHFNMNYDIALVELTTSVSVTECIDYASIVDENYVIADGLQVKAIGFGMLEDNNYPDTLHEATSLKIMNQQDCETEFCYLNGTFNAHLCTTFDLVEGQNTCDGDSGGGLYYEDDEFQAVLIGVIAFVKDTCEDGITSYAKVNYPVILNWIRDKTGNAINTVTIDKK